MAEQERLTNKERRQRGREERKRKAEEEAKAARRRRIISVLSTIVVLAIIGAVVATAFLGDDDVIDEAIVLNSEEITEAREAAGCEVLAEQPEPGAATHFPNASAPPADQLYAGVRPAHSGPHLEQTLPIIRRGSDNQLDERGLLHNLEHGSVAAWYDPEQLEDGIKDDMEDWSARLIESGFAEPRAGTGIYVSPYTEPGITSGKTIAFRAWGFAMDCDEWDEDVAYSVVLERYGSHGIAPERTFAPFPEELLRYEDRDVEDTSTEDAPVGEPTETGTPTETATDGAATEEPPATEEPTTSEPTETTS
ncbi:MAG: DUF3105 domain-containing protein [Actinobacteria bacterium]|nr:DUF3105 domain-containing protein [Actinomycetota bacterium]